MTGVPSHANGPWRARNAESGGDLFQVLISQSDAKLSGLTFVELNASLLKSFLYFEDRGKISFHDPLVLFDALQGCQADPCPPGELVLAPA
jgi:hypothetical protein